MNRETKEIKIGSHTFVVKTYATAREVKAMQEPYVNGVGMQMVDEKPKFGEVNASVMFELESAMITNMVVSLDGNDENVTERCLDLPSDIYNDLLEQLDSLVSKKKK